MRRWFWTRVARGLRRLAELLTARYVRADAHRIARLMNARLEAILGAQEATLGRLNGDR